jgi:hypothetical protein
MTYERRECVGWPTLVALRLVSGGLVVGLVVLMLGLGYHLLSTPPPSAEEQRLAVRQEQMDVQARQQAVERERVDAAADARLDASWRPWRIGALNLMVISLALAPVVGLVGGAVLLVGRTRSPRGVGGRPAMRAVLASVRGRLPWRRSGLRRPMSRWQAPSEPAERDAG